MEKRSVSKFKRFTITFISVVAILCLAVGVFCIIKNANNNTESLKSDIGALGSQIVGTTNSTGKNNSTSNPKNSQKDSVNSANNSLGLEKSETDSKTDKIESLNYVVSFDNETATLTYDLSKAQINNASLAIDSNSIFSELPDFKEGVLSVYPGYHGKAIKKIIFKSNYMQKDKNLVQIKSKITNFSMKFSSDWSEDIEIEFADFAFSAPNEKVALDLSEISSKNVTINAINNVEIRGGNAQSTSGNGFEAIVSVSDNLTIQGDNLIVYGGNGANATTAGGNGSNGGIAIIANDIAVNMDVGTLKVYGGSGGNGATGSKGKDGSNNDEPGLNGSNGGNGGNGASAIKCRTITTSQFSTTTLIAGDGGSGAAGGRGGNGADDNMAYLGSARLGKGGDGGNGGKGGTCSEVVVTIDDSVISLGIICVEGHVGAGGRGGDGGDGGDANNTAWEISGADGGSGGIGGLYGDGITRAENGTPGKKGA